VEAAGARGGGGERPVGAGGGAVHVEAAVAAARLRCLIFLHRERPRVEGVDAKLGHQ
jgi:hypothetical protein